MSDETDLRLEVWIEAAPETVFTLLTDPTHMKTWFAELVEADARPGGVFRISGPRGAWIEGTYVEVVVNRKVVFTWGGVEGLAPGQSMVEFLLEPDGAGTLLRLRHYRLPPPSVEAHRRGWMLAGLVNLKDAAEGRRPTRLCESYPADGRGAT